MLHLDVQTPKQDRPRSQAARNFPDTKLESTEERDLKWKLPRSLALEKGIRWVDDKQGRATLWS